MASHDPSSRDWRAHPPIQSRYARDWRAHGARDSRWSRRTKLRILAASLFVVASVIGFLLFLPSATPSVHILAFGIGRYDQLGMPINPAGTQDARAFEQLRKKFPSRFPDVRIADDFRSGAALTQHLSEEAQEKSLAGQHWIVYLTLHATATTTGDINLYAIEATADSPDKTTSAMVPLSDVLDKLRGSRARRTLLVLDGSRLGSHWRMGALANDVAAQLIHMLGSPNSFNAPLGSKNSGAGEAADAVGKEPEPTKTASLRGLTVLYAAGPGQRSWTTSQGSLFVQHLIAGLSGEADGWTEKSGQRKVDPTAKDFGIKLRELVVYVQEQLHQSARDQSVLWLGDSDDFTLTTVTTEEKPVESKDEKVAAADDKSKSASSATDSKDSGDGKGAKSETPTAANATSSGTTDSSKPATESGTKPIPAAAPSSTPAEPVKVRLTELWKWRDALRSSLDPGRNRIAQRSPFAFKALEAHLALAEILQDNGWEDEAHGVLNKAKDIQTKLPSSQFGLSDLNTKAATQEALQEFFPSEVSPEALAQAKQFAEWLLVDPVPNQPPPPQAKEPSAAVLGQWFLQELKRSSSAESTTRLHKIWERLVAKDRVPPTAEMALVLDSIQAGQEQVGGLSPELISSLVTVRSELQSIVKRYPTVVPGIRGSLERALRLLDAAEAWFLHVGGKSTEGRDWLADAEVETQRIKQFAESQSKAVTLSGDLLVELAPLAEWIATRSMDDSRRPVDWSKMRELAKNWQAMTRQRTWDNASSLKLLDLWPDKPEVYVRLERSLLTACAGAQQLKAKLSQDPEHQRVQVDPDRGADAASLAKSFGADSLDDVTRTVGEHRRDLLDQVRRVIPRSVGSDAPSPALWREADRLRFQPWLSVDERKDVTAIRQRTPRAAPTSGSSLSLEQLALWQGFWAVLTLSVLDAPEDAVVKLWQSWDELADVVQRGKPDDADKSREGRIKLGAAIRKTWGDMQTQPIPERFPFSASLTAARLDATARPVFGTPDEQWKAAEQRGFAEGLLLFAEDWQRRAGRTSQRSSRLANQLARQSRDVARELGLKTDDSDSSTSRTFEVSSVKFDSDRRRGHCEVSFDNTANTNQLQLLVNPSPAVRVEPQQLRRAIPAEGKLSLDFNLAEVVQSPQRLALVLLTADGFPLEFRQVPVLPPFDPSQWSIRFLDVASGQVLDENEGRFGQRERGIKVFLAPAGTTQIKAELVRPATDQRTSAKLTLSRRTADGLEILVKDVPLTLTPGQEQTPLPLNLGGGTEKDTKGTDAPPPLNKDLSRGWVFQITPEPENESAVFEFHVRPTFYSAKTFVNPPKPALTDDRLQVTVERPAATPSNPRDKLLPPKIAVQLHVADSLQGLATDRVLGSPEPTLTLGQQTRLGFLLPNNWRDLIRPPGWDLALDVAGLPHAFRWQITPNGTVNDLSGTPPWLNVQLDNGRALPILVWGKDPKSQETLKLRIQLDATELDRSGETEDWRLAYEVVRQLADGVAKAGLEKSWPVPASLNHQVRLESLQGGVWKLSTSVSDYMDEEKIDGLSGRFELQVRLLHGGKVQAKQELQFAIDDDSKAKLQIEGLDRGPYRTDQPLKFKVVATDSEAGIVRLVYGFDTNGDKQLQEEEQIGTKPFDWFENTKATWDVTVPQSRIPVLEKKEMSVRLIVVAENGLGKETIQSQPVPLIKVGPDKLSTGSLKVSFRRDGSKGTASIELTGPENHSVNPAGDTHRFAALPPGNYTVKVEMKYPVLGIKEEGERNVTVKVGEETQIQVPVATAKPPLAKKKGFPGL